MKKYILLLVILLVMVVLHSVAVVNAGEDKDVKWGAHKTSKITDIYPMYENGLGFMIHFENGWWVTRWKNRHIGDTLPIVGERGTFFDGKRGDQDVWKWEKSKVKPKVKPKPKIKIKIKVKDTPTPIIIVAGDWQRVTTSLSKHKIVIIKFNDGRTSTAYLNVEGEWKLHINKNKYRGGETIRDISFWKDAGL